MRTHDNYINYQLYILKKESTANKCYQCSSKKDVDCTINKVHLKYLKLCPPSHPYCRKAVYACELTI